MAFYEQQILEYLQAHKEEIFSDLLELVKAPSPSAQPELSNQCAAALRKIVKERLGLEPDRVISQPTAGDHLVYRYGTQEQQILVLGHYDTVWEKDQLPIVEKEGALYGPGVLDMKSGDISVIWSLKACKELNIPLDKQICVLFNSDEEPGSHTSRHAIEEEAKKSLAALIAEPAANNGDLKSGRKGVRFYGVEITGKAAHAGNDPLGGASAIKEAAHQILYIQSLSDYEKGTTLNVGVIKGGSQPNVIPDFCRLEVDLRTTTVAEAKRIHELLSNLKPVDPKCTIKLDDNDEGRLPFEETPESLKLFQTASECAQRLGFQVGKAFVGGGSDGNLTSSVGCPTLDGLGAVGSGMHALNEHLDTESYLPRIAMLAGLLTQL